MSIRLKIILVVLPLVIVLLFAAGGFSYYSASRGINNITRDFFLFKLNELEKYSRSQWRLLEENQLTAKKQMVQAAENAVFSYAQGILTSKSEIIFAIDQENKMAMNTSEIDISEVKIQQLKEKIQNQPKSTFQMKFADKDRVGIGFHTDDYKWTIILCEEREVFYSTIDQITLQTLIIVVAGSLAAVLLILLLINILTRPLLNVVSAMEKVITDNDLSAQVDIEYPDEIGKLAHTFNIMLGQLDKAYKQIKNYAFEAVLSQKSEQKIRNIFQKYVPQDLIDRFFDNPESMLVGEDRLLSVLFSDIRSFTTISEAMPPDELVNSLNRYFSIMVEIIMDNKGIIDKYIGDAIMAFFGAPVKHEHDALHSVEAGLDMLDALKDFNKVQRENSKPEFQIGIGINYGLVTVGNIGSERKMDYTVIGDMVNLASRLEGLTKYYQQKIIISEFLYEKVKNKLPGRLLDSVAVKGRKKGVKIYSVTRSFKDNTEEKAWHTHNKGMQLYFDRNFKEAARHFAAVKKYYKNDYISDEMEKRCYHYIEEPPAKDWDGTTVMKSK